MKKLNIAFSEEKRRNVIPAAEDLDHDAKRIAFSDFDMKDGVGPIEVRIAVNFSVRWPGLFAAVHSRLRVIRIRFFECLIRLPVGSRHFISAADQVLMIIEDRKSVV